MHHFQTSARQNKIISLLETFSVPHVLVDLSAKDRERRDQIEFMKAKAKKREGQDTALPPQIFNSGKYCGVSRGLVERLAANLYVILAMYHFQGFNL